MSNSLGQFKMVFMHLEKPICAPPRLSEVFPAFPWNGSNVCLVDDGPLLSFQGRLSSASSLNTAVQQLIRMKLSHTLVSLTSVFSKSKAIKIKAFNCWFWFNMFTCRHYLPVILFAVMFDSCERVAAENQPITLFIGMHLSLIHISVPTRPP